MLKKGGKAFKRFLDSKSDNIHEYIALFILILICLVSALAIYRWIDVNIEWDLNAACTSDDQRSTLWPMTISLVAAMLGCLFTTYIFLKGALDDTLKDKPYYRSVLDSYRRGIVSRLWFCACIMFAFILLVLTIYGCFYFWSRRTWKGFRFLLFILYFGGILLSINILYKCIYIERGLHKTAKKQLKKSFEQLDELDIRKTDISKFSSVLEVEKSKLIPWLQIAGDKNSTIDEKKFISRFSDWESLLMTLVQQDGGLMDYHLLAEQLEFVLHKGMDSYYPKSSGRFAHPSIEWSDSSDNNWQSSTVDKVFRCAEVFRETADKTGNLSVAHRLVEEYQFLAKCRDLLKILNDNERIEEDAVGWDIEDQNRLACVFFSFLAGLSTLALRLSPRIEIFFPTGRFTAADFYSVRFENSSFRASCFTDSIFARAKIMDSNFSICKFERCEFFSVDCRDCSFSNTYMNNCSFLEAIAHYVDFTGAEMTACNFTNASFYNAVFLNMTLDRIVLQGSSFTDCKLDNINISLYEDSSRRISLNKCYFSGCTLTNIHPRLSEKFIPARSAFQDIPVVAEFQTIVNTPDIRDTLFPPEENAREAGLSKMVDRFTLKNQMFSRHPAANGLQNKIPYHPMWNAIKEWSFVSVEEGFFENTVMPAFRLYRADLGQSVLRAVQMNDAQFFCVYMSGCILPQINLREARLWGVVLQSSMLEEAIFFRAVCKLVNFEDAALRSVHASESRFQYCSFSRSDCQCIDLTRARLDDCLFWDSILTEAELTGAEFHSVQFDNSMADKMLASYTVFSGCSLSNAYLSGSNFNYTIFEDCNFCLANFSGSNITNAVFRRCNFAGSNFENACFISTRFESCQCLRSGRFQGARFIAPSFHSIEPEFLEQLEKDGAVQELEEMLK